MSVMDVLDLSLFKIHQSLESLTFHVFEVYLLCLLWACVISDYYFYLLQFFVNSQRLFLNAVVNDL